MQNVEQQDILTRLKSDDKSALKDLFQQYYPYVCNAIHRLIKDRAMVEDLAQEVFLRFWQKRHTITITSSVQAYLRRMAINEALAHLRSQKYFTDELTTENSEDVDESVEEKYLNVELEDHIRIAIDTLPPKCRTVFKLSRFEELSYKEIADKLNISVKTVENQMGKALKVLRKELKAYLHLLF